VVLIPKNRFREKHICCCWTQQNRFSLFLFCSLFFFFSFLQMKCILCFPYLHNKGRKGEKKKKKKRVQRTTQGLEPVQDIWKCKNRIPFYDYQKRKGRMEREKRAAFRYLFRWKFSVKQNTGVLLHLLVFSTRLFLLFPR